jgi:hypothetical protein
VSEVNLQLVREFFELNGFRVQTQWRREGDGQQLYVENPRFQPSETPETVLRAEDLHSLERALVEVRAWHGERMYASVIENAPILTLFAREEHLAPARAYFGVTNLTTIAVLSELPINPEPRMEAVLALRKGGVDHVLEFETVLSDLIQRVSESGAYPASSTLQTIQLLKRYRLVRRHQLEFTYPMEAPVDEASRVETSIADSTSSDE